MRMILIDKKNVPMSKIATTLIKVSTTITHAEMKKDVEVGKTTMDSSSRAVSFLNIVVLAVNGWIQSGPLLNAHLVKDRVKFSMETTIFQRIFAITKAEVIWNQKIILQLSRPEMKNGEETRRKEIRKY